MAVSLLGAKTHGTGFPQVFRVVNSAATALGETFATVRLTGAPTGVFVAGESLSFAGGGSATLTQAALAGPDRLVVASPTGALSGLITGGTSGATATVSAVEALEDLPTRNAKIARTVEFRGAPYVVCYGTIYRLDETLGGSGGRWVEAYRFVNQPTSASTARSKVGLYVLNKNGIPHLATFWTPTGISNSYRAISADGFAWSELLVTSTGITNAGEQRAAVFNNVLYIWSFGSSQSMSWDPATDGVVTHPNVTGFPGTVTNVLCSIKNRVFLTAVVSGGNHVLYELLGGTWTSRAVFAGGSIDVHGRSVSWIGNDGFLYSITQAGSTGWYALKWNVDAFSVTNVSTPVLPAALRNGAGSPIVGAWDVYQDSETAAPGTDNADVVTFLWHSTDSTVGSARATYSFADDVTEIALEDTGGAPQEISLPGVAEGGGHRTFFTGEFDFAFTGPPSPIVGGERWSFLIYKKPGTADVPNVKFRALWRRTTDATKGGVPGRWGFINAVNAGAISVGNREVTGLVADSVPGTPGTVYTADVLLVSQDGVPNFSRVTRAGLVYL